MFGIGQYSGHVLQARSFQLHAGRHHGVQPERLLFSTCPANLRSIPVQNHHLVSQSGWQRQHFVRTCSSRHSGLRGSVSASASPATPAEPAGPNQSSITSASASITGGDSLPPSSGSGSGGSSGGSGGNSGDPGHSQGDDDNEHSGKHKPQPWWQRLLVSLLKAMAVAAAASLLLTASLPAILSTPRGLAGVLKVVNKFAPGTVSIKQASLGWRRPLVINHLQLTEPESLGGEILVAVDQISSTRSLWSIVTGRPFDLIVAAPYVDCSMAPDGQLKFVRLLKEWQVVHEAKARHVPKMPVDSSTGAAAAAPDAQGPESAAIKFTAEGRLLTAQLYASDGVLQLPVELQQVVGSNLHAAVLIGAKNLANEAADFGVDADWVATQHAPRGAASGLGQGPDPTIVVMNSEHVSAELSGWRTPRGLLLRKPVSASVDYTPALAKFFLARINPLLGNSVTVEEGGTVRVDVTPLRNHVPAESLAIRAAPLKLVVGRGSLLGDALRMLGQQGGTLGSLGKLKRLEVWTSAAHAEVFRDGPVVTKRVDLLVGSGSKGVHLALWGQLDPTTNWLAMTLGIPAGTLALAGIGGLPPDTVFPVQLSGTIDHPKVDWIGASRRLAALAVKQQSVAAATEHCPQSLRTALLKDALRGVGAKLAGKGASSASSLDMDAAPAPIEPLPWAKIVQRITDESAPMPGPRST